MSQVGSHTPMVDMYMSDFGNIRIAAPSLRQKFRTEGLYGDKAFRRGGNTWFARFEKKINTAAEYFWRMGSILEEINENGQYVIMEPQFPLPAPAPYNGWRMRYVREIGDDTDISQVVSEVCGTCIDGPLTFAEFMGRQ